MTSLAVAACLTVPAMPTGTAEAAPPEWTVYVDDFTGDDTRGRFVIEAEHYAVRLADEGGGWWEVDGATHQFLEGPDMGQTAPNSVPNARGNYMETLGPFDNSQGIPPIESGYHGSTMEYRFAVETAGDYRLYARWRGDTIYTDSIYASIWRPDGTLLTGAGPQWFTFHQARSGWIWDDRGIQNSTFVSGVGFPDRAIWTIAEPGIYTLRISQRELTSALDALVLQTDGSSAPSGLGPPESEFVINEPPTFDKAFTPDSIVEATNSTLTFTIDNSAGALAASALDFTDNLPAGVVVATPPVVSTTCTGGAIGASGGATTITYTAGAVAAGSTCTVSVDVTATAVGSHVNITGDLTSRSGNSGAATDTLTVSAPGHALTMVTGARYTDTRSGGATFDGLFQAAGQRAAGSTYEVTIAGRGDIPGTAVGVIANLTAVSPSADGFATTYPCMARPIASSLNYTAGVDVANEILAELSPTGSLCVYTFAVTDLVIDVVGYVLADDTIKPLTPARLAESREGAPTVDGVMAGFGRTTAGSTTELQVTGRGAVPAAIHAAIVNVAAVDPTDDGFITVHRCGTTLPIASSTNFTAGVNRANELIAEVNDSGKICLFTDRSVDLIVDVMGYVEVGSDLVSDGPTRFADSRGGATVDGVGQGGGPLAPLSTTEVQISGRDGVPANAIAAVANVAAVDPLAAGFLTVTGCVTPTPNVSSLNYTTGVNGALELVVGLSPTGKLCVFTDASTDFIVDVVGYLKPAEV